MPRNSSVRAKQQATTKDHSMPSRPIRAQQDPRKIAEPVAIGADALEEIDDRICATLASAINQGALKPGAKILEDAIAEHFAVSRTVVRGALGILQRDHLLERKRNRGTFVAEPSVEEARQLFAARRTLERAILEMVIANATPDALDRLDAAAEEEKRIHASGDQPSKTGLSGQFHLELARLGGNGVLTELLGKVVARLSLVMARFEVQHRDECGADHHLAIVAAIRRKNVAEAQRLMEEHLGDIEARVQLTENQGDRHSFEAMLATFSGK
jgi:DNA-binding GntR family transcriptional regulator